MRTFLSSNGKTGFALKGNDIVSVFNADPAVKGAASEIIAKAVSAGGRRLDAFETVLPKLYGGAGFRAVARMPWNDQYAPPDWKAQQFAAYNGGKPDVVFMVYDPSYGQYKPGDGKRVASYAEGVAAQEAALRSTPLATGGPSIDYKNGELSATGDLSDEIIRAGTRSGEIAEHFKYSLEPFAKGDFSEAQVPVELLLAQAAALYHTNPGLVRAKLPRWFHFMESIYGEDHAIQDRSISEIRDSLQKALQDSHAAIGSSGNIGRTNQIVPGRGLAGAGTSRGPPGEGMGGRVGANQANSLATGAAGPRNNVANVRTFNNGWGALEPGAIDRLLRDYVDNRIARHACRAWIETGMACVCPGGVRGIARHECHHTTTGESPALRSSTHLKAGVLSIQHRATPPP